jgi:hypothetical protein
MNSASRDDGAMMVAMVLGESDVRRSFLEISIYFHCRRGILIYGDGELVPLVSI